MREHEVREAILASGTVASLEGLEDGNHPRLVQFRGAMACGREYSVRGTRYGVSLDVRAPDTYRDQTPQSCRKNFEPNIVDGPNLLRAICEAVLPWLVESEAQAQAAPAPELLSPENLARVREAQRLLDEAQAVSYEARWGDTGEKTEAEADEEYTKARAKADSLRAQWEVVFRDVYTWTPAS